MSLPERLGRLRRVERVGAGGFATVWRYYDEELDSDVAVKALADNWSGRGDVRARFLEEARILRRADADHVVRVYDIGETADGTPYFVMSYADQGTVADLIGNRARLRVEDVVDVVSQASRGLQVLHRNGIIHRDIKPQNLLLRSRPDGSREVLVADLGVAKAAAHGSGLTQVVGTPAFIAPEQAMSRAIDARADVHALGAVAYLMLTGNHVREGGFGSLLSPTVPPRPSTVAEVPEAFDAPVLKAIELEPDDRWGDVESFSSALTLAAAVARTSPTNVRRASNVVDADPVQPPPRGGRWVLGALAMAVLLGSFVTAYLVAGRIIG